MNYHELQTSWYYFLSIERDIEEAARYIEPNGQEDTYSFEFYKIIMLSCSEIETMMKQICAIVDPSANRGNIAHWKEIILKKFPNIGDALVFVPRWNGKNLYPFRGWDTGKLVWWESYQNLKHRRYTEISCASYKNAVTALAGLYILILYLFALCGYDCKGDESHYFESEYYPQPLYDNRPNNLPNL